MNIKSLLIGSVAAFAAVSGAQAADAIVAAQPEPMEYVRVCDAFGTGYFYLPGTQTCLKVGGYVRNETFFARDTYVGAAGTDDWDNYSRVQLDFTAKNDTELGTLTSLASVRFDYGNDATWDNNTNAVNPAYINEAYVSLGGFKIGRFWNWWDANDLPGELDVLGSERMNSIQYMYTGTAFSAGVQVDELSRPTGQNLGVEAIVQAAIGAAKLEVLGSWDFDQDNGAIRAIGSVAVGPGTFYLSGIYSTGLNAYFGYPAVSGGAEATIAAAYSFKATDKLEIIPEAQYLWKTGLNANNDWTGPNAWGAGVTANYQIVTGLAAKLQADYVKTEGAKGNFIGMVRFQRDF